MSKYKFVVCTVNSYFDAEMDQTMCTVDKVLQVFETEEDADAALEIMNPSYDYNLNVVHVSNLNSAFR